MSRIAPKKAEALELLRARCDELLAPAESAERALAAATAQLEAHHQPQHVANTANDLLFQWTKGGCDLPLRIKRVRIDARAV